jgi:hypothetical protein
MENSKLLFGFVILMLVVYLGVEFVPPYYANYEFQDELQSQALRSTYTPQKEDDIRDSVYKTAQQIGVPLTKEQIKVTRTGAQYTGAVAINVHYSVHLNLPGYPYDLQFDPSSNNKSPW